MKRLILLLVATMVLVPGVAWAAVPSDPRITAAKATWATSPLYVDPDYAAVVDATQSAELLREIKAAPLPVYVAVVPTGEWFDEQGDTTLLAGWLAAAHGKPGLYVVMDGDTTYGVEHEIAAWAPESTWAEARQSIAGQLAEYLEDVKVDDDRYDAKPARTEPLPPRPERSSTNEPFTVGKAIGNGVGGGVLGLMGGASLAAVVLGVAALVARRRGGTQ
ncbi:hypothetical protein ACIBL3_01530 [Kribbella sp. NPDC050124]|uniref:hypothetical protein n=1 Tax=Kribbella sp. NPDC050124 TaxID=3364114 RepID=UPI00378896C5